MEFMGSQLKKFIKNLQSLLDDYISDILILMETKITSTKAPRIERMENFDGFLCSKAKGFAGVFGFFWKKVNVSIETLSVNDQVVSIAILSNFNVQ